MCDICTGEHFISWRTTDSLDVDMNVGLYNTCISSSPRARTSHYFKDATCSKMNWPEMALPGVLWRYTQWCRLTLNGLKLLFQCSIFLISESLESHRKLCRCNCIKSSDFLLFFHKNTFHIINAHKMRVNQVLKTSKSHIISVRTHAESMCTYK